MADNATAQPTKPGAAHEQMNILIGKWHAEGESSAVRQTKKTSGLSPKEQPLADRLQTRFCAISSGQWPSITRLNSLGL